MASVIHPLRLYLASVPGEMDGERAVVEGLVLPELRERAHGLGIEIAVVDPLKAKGEEWDLARRFRESEGCEIFVGLLGERYGEPPAAVPLSLVAAHPWLAEDPGRSVVELEILQGALREPGRRVSFFYFREPRFTGLVPAEQRGRFVAENEEAASRLAGLKDRIRASGRPVLDGYPCGWSEGLGRAARLDGFAERVLEDLWREVQGTVRSEPLPSTAPPPEPEPEPPPAHPPPEKALPLHENVQFTVYRPRVVEPSRWFPLLAFAHLEELPPEASAEEPDPVEEVQRQARQILGDMAQGYADVKQDSRYAIPHEAEITFVPEIPGFEVNPPRRTFLWLESVHREEFRIRAGPQLAGTAVRGRMSVFWGSIILAEVSLAIRVEARIAAVSPPPERTASRPFRNIFPSYSHKDAGIVEEFERYARSLGDRYLRDVHELRAGEVWNDRLKELIQKADVFQLFWSWNALSSPYVEEEWRYALSLGRPHFVRPTYWQDPLPEEPARSLPPEELRRLHFQLLPGGKTDSDLNATVVSFPRPSAPEDADEDRGVMHNIDWRADAEEDEGDATADSTAAALDQDFLDQIQRGIVEPPPPSLPPLPAPVAAAARPPSPPSPAAMTSYSGSYAPPPVRSGSRRWMGVAAMIAVAVIGLSVFLLRSRSAPEPQSTSSGPTLSGPNPNLSGPDPEATPNPSPSDEIPIPSFPIIDAPTWQRLAAACRLDEARARETPTRMTAGSPIVQVFSSEDWIDAARALARFSSRGAFILPREEEGHAVCTVAFGPFPSEQEATQAAADLHASDGVDARVVPYPGFAR